MGHQMWTQLGCSKHDYNYVYETPTTEAIYDLMPLEERSAIKVRIPLSIFWERLRCLLAQ